MKVLVIPDSFKQSEGYDGIVTGEGRTDAQSFQGKLLGRLHTLAREHQVPLLVFCGSLDPDFEPAEQVDDCFLFPITPGPCSLDEAMARARESLFGRVRTVFALLQRGR